MCVVLGFSINTTVLISSSSDSILSAENCLTKHKGYDKRAVFRHLSTCFY